jgi:predicted metal-binding membrane protein
VDAHSALQAALKRDRVIVAAGLAGLIVLSWIYLLTTALDMYGSMSGPSAWLSHGWRPGCGGALGMGASHGLYCVGCCWVLMLLLCSSAA